MLTEQTLRNLCTPEQSAERQLTKALDVQRKYIGAALSPLTKSDRQRKYMRHIAFSLPFVNLNREIAAGTAAALEVRPAPPHPLRYQKDRDDVTCCCRQARLVPGAASRLTMRRLAGVLVENCVAAASSPAQREAVPAGSAPDAMDASAGVEPW